VNVAARNGVGTPVEKEGKRMRGGTLLGKVPRIAVSGPTKQGKCHAKKGEGIETTKREMKANQKGKKKNERRPGNV